MLCGSLSQAQLREAEGLPRVLAGGQRQSVALACPRSGLGSPDLARRAGRALAPLLPGTGLPGEHKVISAVLEREFSSFDITGGFGNKLVLLRTVSHLLLPSFKKRRKRRFMSLILPAWGNHFKAR